MIDWKIITIIASVIAIAIDIDIALVLPPLPTSPAAEPDNTRRPGLLASLFTLTPSQTIQRL